MRATSPTRYVAVLPRGRPPAANRPPADRAVYLARTEVAAWSGAEKTLAAGASVGDLVRREFSTLFPGQVNSVVPVVHSRRLATARAEYDAVTRALADLLDDYTAARRRGRGVNVPRKTVNILGKKYGDWGRSRYGAGMKPVPVDALAFGVDRAAELRRAILEVRSDPHALRPMPAAFVTFKSRRAAVLAATALLHHDVSSWHASAAPGPEEVRWDALPLRAWERAVRNVAGWAILVTAAAAFLVPVTLIQTLLELPRLQAAGGRWVKDVLTFSHSPVHHAVHPAPVLPQRRPRPRPLVHCRHHQAGWAGVRVCGRLFGGA